MTLVYYAEAIDAARTNGTLGDELVQQLAKLDIATYRPLRAWTAGHNAPLRVEHTNRQALTNSHLILADLTCGSPSIGVPAEIEHATRVLGIPALVMLGSRTSVTLEANPLVTLIPYEYSTVQIAALVARTAHQHTPQPTQAAATQDNLLRYTLCDDTVPPLTRAYQDDAGIDLTCNRLTTIPPGGFADIPTTVTGIQLPSWAWGMVVGRSSTLRKRGLLVPPGIIDTGWRGPLFVGVQNLTNQLVTVLNGDRIAQFIIMNNHTAGVAITPVDQLDPHERGTNGFGSTG